jgi:hypothetical protein
MNELDDIVGIFTYVKTTFNKEKCQSIEFPISNFPEKYHEGKGILRSIYGDRSNKTLLSNLGISKGRYGNKTENIASFLISSNCILTFTPHKIGEIIMDIYDNIK